MILSFQVFATFVSWANFEKNSLLALYIAIYFITMESKDMVLALETCSAQLSARDSLVKGSLTKKKWGISVLHIVSTLIVTLAASCDTTELHKARVVL